MRCARHPYEGGVGVCAPCLRDRLLALAAAQNAAVSSLPPPPPPQPPQREPPELLFARSVSPYVCRRKSEASAPRGGPPGGLLFFRTPQVGPACGGGAGFVEGDIGFRRRRSGRFSLLAALFGNRSDEEEETGNEAPIKHRSWFAEIVPRWRGKKEAETFPPRRSCHAFGNQGISQPARYAYGVPAYRDGGEESTSPAESPRLPSPSPLRKSPCRRLLAGAGAGVSGFAVCISPLVRPSPGRHQRGGPAPDAAAVHSELRPSPLHQLSSTGGTSLTHCRSWKLADGGRFR